MRMPVNALVAALLSSALGQPLAVAQGGIGEESQSRPSTANRPSTGQGDPGQVDYRQKTRFRVLDRAGKAWVDAHVVAYSRPVEGLVDRIEGQSSKRGRAALRLLPGRSYIAWAWAPVPKSASGEYRISTLDLRVAAGGIVTLRESSSTRLQVQVELVGAERWKGPLTARFAGYLNPLDRSYFSLDVPIQKNRLVLPICPKASGSLYIFDEDRRLVGTGHFNLSKRSQEALLKAAETRRQKKKDALEAKRKQQEAKDKKEREQAPGAKGTPDAKPEQQASAAAEKADAAKAKARLKAKKAALKKAMVVQVGKAKAFQVVQLGPLVQGVNVISRHSAASPALDYVGLSKVRWRVDSPYHFRVRFEDKETQQPIAKARIFESSNGITYELGETDAKGMATITMAMRMNEKTGRPLNRFVNFRVHAKGYPETYVRRSNLMLPPYRKISELEADKGKPLFVSKLAKGFGIQGRVLLTEGNPLAGMPLILRTGFVYDYGNRNQGFSPFGSSYRVTTDAEGRFEWPSCDERFLISVSAMLPPEVLASLEDKGRFPTSARVLLYQDRGKGGKAGQVILLGGGQILLGGAKPAQKKKGDKSEKKKSEEPTIRDLGDLRIDKLASVCVQVVRSDGTPTAFARIGLASPKGGQSYYSPPLHLSNRLGRLRVLVPAGKDYILGAGIKGQSLLRKLTLPAKEPILISLVGGLVLSGRIVDPNGDPLEGANVYVYPYGGVKVLHQGLWNALRGGNASTRSQADGSFEVAVLADSAYTFQVNYIHKKRSYNAGQRMIDMESSSQDMGDLEIPIPVEKKDKKAKKKEAASQPSK